MIGPVSASVVALASVLPWLVGGIETTSLGLVKEYAAQNGFGFLVDGDLDSAMELTTAINVSYDQPAGGFEYCNTTLSYDAARFSLELAPGFGPVHTPWKMRSGRPEYMAADLNDYRPEITFTAEPGKLYTLVMMDPIQKVGRGVLAYLHALYSNIAGVGDVVSVSAATGFQAPYLGPGNGDDVAHIYELMVFEQAGGLVDIDPASAYAQQLLGREGFNLTRAREELRLGAIRGVSWAQAYNDPYANLVLYNLGIIPQLPCAAFLNTTSTAAAATTTTTAAPATPTTPTPTSSTPATPTATPNPTPTATATTPTPPTTANDAAQLALVAEYAAQNGFGYLVDGDLDSAMELSTMLTVSYDQPAGGFEYCNTMLSYGASHFSLELAPGFGPVHTPWEIRSGRPEYTAADLNDYRPEITFTAEPGKLYTLVMMDALQKVGQPLDTLAYLHALYFNIAAGDVSSASGFQVPYFGPGNPSATVAHIYEFLLFEQTVGVGGPGGGGGGGDASVDIDPASVYGVELSGRSKFNLTKLREEARLGPIRGISWAQVYNDYYANVVLQAIGFYLTLPCDDFVPPAATTTAATQHGTGGDVVGVAVGVPIAVLVVVAAVVAGVLVGRNRKTNKEDSTSSLVGRSSSYLHRTVTVSDSDDDGVS
jgi:hypothetical protein